MSSFEREIKLCFDTLESAHAAVAALGATLVRGRRLQDDLLLDAEDARLQQRGCALRVRRDGDGAVLTWKGPVLPSEMKLREEIETSIGSADAVLRILAELGFRPGFRYQKFRTELALPHLIVAIDETPIGIFVELEGDQAAIADAAARLGRSADDYVRASYRSLFLEHRERAGGLAGDPGGTAMVFDPS